MVLLLFLVFAMGVESCYRSPVDIVADHHLHYCHWVALSNLTFQTITIAGSILFPNSLTCNAIKKDFVRDMRHTYPAGESRRKSVVISPA